MTIQTVSPHPHLVIDTTQLSNFSPIRFLEIDLNQALTDIPVTRDIHNQPYQKAIGIVRLHSQPLGIVEFMLNNGTLSGRAQADYIWEVLGEQINTHLRQDGIDPIAQLGEQGITSWSLPACIAERERFLLRAPFVSIIVATRDRPESLRRCLDALLILRYPHFEIIVVDNAPNTSMTAELIKQSYQGQVRYVKEDRRGLSLARNRGIQEARGTIIAITDDDVLVDANWLFELVHNFQTSEKVVCVTGLVLPIELETQSQAWIEQFGGFSKGFKRSLFDMDKNHPGTPLFPYTTGRIGTGANFAFKASYLREVGGFDPTLGTGTLTQGGEDLALLLQILMQGYTIVYEPAALLYHHHRRDYADLCKQIYGYGVGLTAYLMKSIMDQPIRIFDIAGKLPYALFFALSARSPKNNYKLADYPKELSALELQGMIYGPWAYLRSRWAFHRAKRNSHQRNSLRFFHREKHSSVN